MNKRAHLTLQKATFPQRVAFWLGWTAITKGRLLEVCKKPLIYKYRQIANMLP